MNSMYMIEALFALSGVITSLFWYRYINTMVPGIDIGYPDIGLSFYNDIVSEMSSYIFNVYRIFLIIIGASGVFIFSSIITRNKFLVLYSLGFKKSEIMVKYFSIFILYSMALLSISYAVLIYLNFLTVEYTIFLYLIIFSLANLVFFVSIGLIIATVTKNLIIPGTSVIILFYIALPLIYTRPQRSAGYAIFNLISFYQNYGFTDLAVQSIIFQMIIAIILLSAAILIADHRDMKVIR